MSIETRVDALAGGIAADVKSLVNDLGDLSSLTTGAKTSLVAAINEVVSAANAASGIDDTATSTGSTWSSSKIDSELQAALSTLATGAPDLLNTIDEIAAALQDNPDVVTNIQALVTANQNAITTLAANVGDTNKDFLLTYTTARDAV